MLPLTSITSSRDTKRHTGNLATPDYPRWHEGDGECWGSFGQVESLRRDSYLLFHLRRRRDPLCHTLRFPLRERGNGVAGRHRTPRARSRNPSRCARSPCHLAKVAPGEDGALRLDLRGDSADSGVGDPGVERLRLLCRGGDERASLWDWRCGLPGRA